MGLKEHIPTILMGLFVLAIYITITIIAFNGSLNDQNERKKSVGIILGVVSVLMIIFTGMIVVYFNSNPAYTNIYLICATSMALLLSLLAVSVSTISLT